MELWPGGGSTLTCGWHLGACYDNDALVTSGGALDWAYAGEGTITFRVYSTSSSSFTGSVGTGFAQVPPQPMCDHRVIIDASDINGGFQTGTHYYHTSNSIAPDTTFNINANPGTWTWTTRTLGSTANEAGCGLSWGGYHVHQIAGSGWALRSYPDHTTCNVDDPPVTNNVTDCWVGANYKQGDKTWWLPFP